MVKKNKTPLNIYKILLYSTIISLLVFGSNYIYQNSLIDKYIYGGNVTGYAFDDSGNPLEGGTAFIIGDFQVIDIDADGKFFIKNLSPGERSLAIGFDGKAVEFPVKIYSRQTVDVGNLTYIYLDY